jgi:UDP-3-O-[3-hydroxymyristoyl] N-acetylglucosamine deacetylase
MTGQTTLAGTATCSGIGLHGGRPCRVRLEPGAAHSGVVFVRADLPGAPEVPARVDRVVETRLATTLGAAGAKVATVEHLLAAVYGLGVDNLRVVLHGPELPALDGSAAPWVYLLREAGLRALGVARRVLVVRRRVAVARGEGRVSIEPAPALELRCDIDFPHPLVGRQRFEGLVDAATFTTDLARARTFGFYEDVGALRAAGLGLGGSLDNCVVVDGMQVLNPDGLRFADEFVRHKALDAVGDLALLGHRLHGRLVSVRGGHALNHALLCALVADARAFGFVEEAPAGTPAAATALATAPREGELEPA